jgi:hypothetical protein
MKHLRKMGLDWYPQWYLIEPYMHRLVLTYTQDLIWSDLTHLTHRIRTLSRSNGLFPCSPMNFTNYKRLGSP